VPLDRGGTIIVDHGYVGSVDRVELISGVAEAFGANGIYYAGVRTPEEPGVWRLADLATAVSLILERSANDCN
jgi:hypothetical protein